MATDSPRFAMVAGEASGDLLAGLLLGGLKARWPGLESHGIGGPRMAEHGFKAWWPHTKLAVRGYTEVLLRLRELLRIRREMGDRVLQERPDAFIGVDAPDFNLGTAQDGGVTRIGNDNWIMAYVHFGHDCQLGDHITISNSVQLAGHVTVGDWVTLGGVTLIHQFCKIGAHVMTGMGSAIGQDVPPFMITTGAPAEVRGLNSEGLRRRGFTPERLAVVKQMHKLLYRQGLTFEAAREAIAALAGTVPEADGDVALMTQFFAASTRGILR